MAGKLIKGLNQIHENYDTFLVDLWGVIHDGIQLHPEAINVLENLDKLNKKFVLITNAPRPSKSVQKYSNLAFEKTNFSEGCSKKKFQKNFKKSR